MGIHIQWDSPDKRIILAQFDERWTWDEYHAGIEQIVEMIEGVPHSVSLINTLADGRFLPFGALSQVIRGYRRVPENMDWIVIVGAHRFFRLFIRSLQRIAPNSPAKTIRFAQSLIEARDFITQLNEASGAESSQQMD